MGGWVGRKEDVPVVKSKMGSTVLSKARPLGERRGRWVGGWVGWLGEKEEVD